MMTQRVWYPAIAALPSRTAHQLEARTVLKPADEVAPPIDYEARGLIRDIPLAPNNLLDARTPADRLFMLAHLGVIRMRPEEQRLDVVGHVEHPHRLRMADLDGLPSARIEAVHQCAGGPLDPMVATRRVACPGPPEEGVVNAETTV